MLHIAYYRATADFHFFHRRGGEILGGVQVICNMPFLMLRKGMKWQTNVRQGEVKRNSNGVKHFLKGVKKCRGGGLTPTLQQDYNKYTAGAGVF